MLAGRGENGLFEEGRAELDGDEGEEIGFDWGMSGGVISGRGVLEGGLNVVALLEDLIVDGAGV